MNLSHALCRQPVSKVATKVRTSILKRPTMFVAARDAFNTKILVWIGGRGSGPTGCKFRHTVLRGAANRLQLLLLLYTQ
jgi:hypothetical protein